jgi:hypothetical protein
MKFEYSNFLFQDHEISGGDTGSVDTRWMAAFDTGEDYGLAS